MRTLITGMILGAAATAIFGLGYAIAEQRAGRPFTTEGWDRIRNTCDVRIGYGSLTSGNRCFFNQVMTGADGNYIYCADVRVTCYQPQ